MASPDSNDLAPAQEKLEWVTPKISVMEGFETEGRGKPRVAPFEFPNRLQPSLDVGPS